MNKVDLLAAHLLSIYWTGAGDAGYDTQVFNLHKDIESLKDEAEVRQVLKDGTSSTTEFDQETITMSDYFRRLAQDILHQLEVPVCPPIAAFEVQESKIDKLFYQIYSSQMEKMGGEIFFGKVRIRYRQPITGIYYTAYLKPDGSLQVDQD